MLTNPLIQVPAAKSAATVTRDPSDILAKPKRTYSQLISEALLNAQNKYVPGDTMNCTAGLVNCFVRVQQAAKVSKGSSQLTKPHCTVNFVV